MGRTWLTHFLAGYASVGLVNGYIMSLAIPAMNYLGVFFYALTWPGFIVCARMEISGACGPLDWMPVWMQAWMFTL